MKLFGTLFPFVETDDESLRLGRFVANYEFLTALLNYSSFDAFHLYCLSPSHFNNTLNRLSSDSSISDTAKSKVELFLFDVLEENLAHYDYHCFHLGGWGYFWSGTVALRNRCARVPFPVTGIIHSLNSTDTVTDAFKLVSAPHQSYDGVICTSESGKEVLRKAIALAESGSNIFRGTLETLPLGFDPIFDTSITREEARARIGLDENDIVLLYLGRLSPTSKADLFPLLQVFRTLKDRYGETLKLVIAGGVKGSELRLHKDMIHDLELDRSVRLMINFDKELKQSIYASADIYVAPSDNIQETFGISIIEAMASGLPVVASDMDGYRELVEHEITGLKVPTIWTNGYIFDSLHDLMDPGTIQLLLAQAMVVVPADLENALSGLISDRELRTKMGEAARVEALKKYRWEVVIHQYEEMWDRLKEKALVEERSEKVSSPYASSLSHLFSHYTTSLFSDTMSVSIRPEGEKLLKTGALPSIYSDMALVLDNEIIVDVLKSCVDKPLTASRISSSDKPKFQPTLLWMAKYDLVKLD